MGAGEGRGQVAARLVGPRGPRRRPHPRHLRARGRPGPDARPAAARPDRGRREELPARRRRRGSQTRGGIAVMKRLMVVLLAGALLVPAATAAPAGAKTKKVCKTVKVHGKKKRRCHRVKVKPVRVPISATVLDGSNATLDFGNGTVRTVALAGKLRGYVPGKIKLGTAITAFLKSGSLSVAPTDFFSDSCASPVWARSNPATSIRLDPAKVNKATLNPNGSITADASVIIRAVLDTRAENA